MVDFRQVCEAEEFSDTADILADRVKMVTKSKGKGKVLNVENLKIGSLPPSLARLVSLQVLQAGTNQLKELPSCVGSLKNLIKLSCDSNELVTVAADIGRLRKLKVLDGVGIESGEQNLAKEKCATRRVSDTGRLTRAQPHTAHAPLLLLPLQEAFKKAGQEGQSVAMLRTLTHNAVVQVTRRRRRHHHCHHHCHHHHRHCHLTSSVPSLCSAATTTPPTTSGSSPPSSSGPTATRCRRARRRTRARPAACSVDARVEPARLVSRAFERERRRRATPSPS